jgi:hypothetical protein
LRRPETRLRRPIGALRRRKLPLRDQKEGRGPRKAPI